ncbi:MULTISPECIES: guanosine monophosphate reductase [unclassified Halobacteriovorax]|uniref:guanosine monophosphate reductase n=1 Tax=unclassified Halobacteriovorax TaxID=2639665 RepID=UPI000CD1604E|nr:IMP dehydrogenase [Halobacteriovorax sp. DA5]POB14273.1 guanosine monophosphate reductase [Halobacteriovorax sp. DA5]
MDLTFKSNGILSRGKGLTFDDVLLVPRYSEISSRRHTDLKTKITKNHTIDIPIIAANMDTITGPEMAMEIGRLGGVGILHRFMSPEQQVEDVKAIQKYFKEHSITLPIAASVGVKEEGMKRADLLAALGVEILTVDIAHGDSIMMMEVLEYIKKNYPQIDVIAGNVATPDGVKRMIDKGADAVKVGIGPGSMCTTRIITGHGVPQLTAVAMCVAEAQKAGIPVIADGGLKNSGDMVKALCAGASSCMAGSLLSGALETPGEVKGGMKEYRGMASKAAQVSWRGELPKGMAAEGVDTMIPCKGPVENIINELTGGIRSGMTYLGVDKLANMSEAALFMEMSSSGMAESKPHGKH